MQDRAIQVQGAHAMLDATLWRGVEYTSKNDELIVFLHGGNFISNSSTGLDEFFRALHDSRPEAAILAPRYTLATEMPFPAPLEDVCSVLLWVCTNKVKLGWSGKSLIIAGIEAGANLAACAALVSRDRRGPSLSAQILLMPMLDPALASRSMRESGANGGQSVDAGRCAIGYRGYLPNVVDRVHPYATPLNSSRLKDLPPTLIFSAENDPLRDEAEAYGAKLISHGVHTSVVRLPAIALESHGARTACAATSEVIAEITEFVRSLPSTRRHQGFSA
jgi:acetyl esterase/lipase